jgi:hypothetical protein
MNKLTQFLLSMFSSIFAGISPQLRTGIEEGLNTLEEKAKKTDNKFDDFLVAMLKNLLGF